MISKQEFTTLLNILTTLVEHIERPDSYTAFSDINKIKDALEELKTGDNYEICEESN